MTRTDNRRQATGTWQRVLANVARCLLPVVCYLFSAPSFADEVKTASVGEYLGELERLRIIDRATGTREVLEGNLQRAEELLAAGDPRGAAVILYGIVESPRFTDFSDFPEYQNAEYDLGVALAASGAHASGMEYLERVLRRGSSGLYFAAAHRRAVDIAIETRRYAEILARLDGVKLNEPLPVEASGERAYLRARVAYDRKQFPAAEGELVKVSRRSRLYTAALYLRGVIRARKTDVSGAQDAFCEIAQTPDTDRYTFYVDDRYFTLKDLARLGLGRLAHEERRYDDAYYHYFQIPDDSERLAEALFEAAWSMYQKRELRTARDLVKELVADFPDSYLVPEAMLLAGYVELADCKFAEASRAFDDVVRVLGPVYDTAVAIQRSPARRGLVVTRALERERARKEDPASVSARKAPRSGEARVLALLRLDPEFVRLNEAAAGLRRDAGDATFVVSAWRKLAGRIGRAGAGGVAPVASASPEEEDARKAAELLEDVRRLRQELRREVAAVTDASRARRIAPAAAAARLGELDQADQKLADLESRSADAVEASDATLVARADPRLRAMVEADLQRAAELSEAATAFQDRMDAEAERLSNAALKKVITELRRVLDKAKLGKVDSVIGQKRLLEIEVEDLAQGRYPAELYERLVEEGQIGDDEEFWPPEEEVWKDEYEGFR
jgi:hypothetical protein